MWQKHLCQQAGQPGKESFNLGMSGVRDDDQQTSVEVAEQVCKQSVHGDVDKRKLQWTK